MGAHFGAPMQWIITTSVILQRLFCISAEIEMPLKNPSAGKHPKSWKALILLVSGQRMQAQKFYKTKSKFKIHPNIFRNIQGEINKSGRDKHTSSARPIEGQQNNTSLPPGEITTPLPSKAFGSHHTTNTDEFPFTIKTWLPSKKCPYVAVREIASLALKIPWSMKSG